jgi:hypothetical protein
MFTRTLFTDRKAILGALVIIFKGAVAVANGQTNGKFPCLAAETNLSEKVNASVGGLKATSLGKRLAQLKARCSRKRLIDRRGREIRIFRHSCWGNPPVNYQDILSEERRTLTTLKRKYTVIEIGCDPSIA